MSKKIEDKPTSFLTKASKRRKNKIPDIAAQIQKTNLQRALPLLIYSQYEPGRILVL
jgi:hypothetical protein